MKTHTLKTLLDMPVDELRVLVAELLPNLHPDDEIDDLNIWNQFEDGLTDEEYVKYCVFLNELCAKAETRKTYILRSASAKAHHRAVAFCCVKLKL